MSALGFVLPAASLGLGSLLLRPPRGFFIKTTIDSLPANTILIPQAIVEERHSDRIVITEHPVEQGAVVADHAYKLPARVRIRCLWSNSPTSSGLFSQAVSVAAAAGGRKLGTAIGVVGSAAATIGAAQSILSGNAPNQMKEIYQQLLDLQSSRVPFDIFTGKRSYKDMLIEELGVTTNAKFENALEVDVDCHQIILAEVQSVVVPLNSSALSNPAANQPTSDTGARSLTPATNFTAQ